MIERVYVTNTLDDCKACCTVERWSGKYLDNDSRWCWDRVSCTHSILPNLMKIEEIVAIDTKAEMALCLQHYATNAAKQSTFR